MAKRDESEDTADKAPASDKAAGISETDEKGIAKLNINLMAGEYLITSTYENGAAISNKITIRN